MPDPRILIDATKLEMEGMDGCKRYVVEIIQGLLGVVERGERAWRIDVNLGRAVLPIEQVGKLLRERGHTGGPVLAGVARRRGEAIHRRRDTLRRKGATLLRKSADVAIKAHGLGVGLLRTTLPRKMYESLRSAKQRIIGPNRMGQNRIGPDRIQPVDYDLIHLTLPSVYGGFNGRPQRLLATVHDLCHLRYPQFQERRNRLALGTGLDFLVRRGSRFIAVSESTRRELIAEYDVQPETVRTIPLACDRERFQSVVDGASLRRVRERYELPAGPYLLSLCTLEPRKNLANTVEAFRRLIAERPWLELTLVIAGPRGWKMGRRFQRRVRGCDKIHFTGYVDEADLPGLYSGALALSYVSFYEGFGLPPLEGMSCGLPVVYGDNSSMPEVIGGAGLGADPEDVADIKKQFERIVLDPSVRERLARRALERATRFSWERTVRQTVEEYDSILNGGSTTGGSSPHAAVP